MSKRELYDNYRVEVYVKTPFGMTPDHGTMLALARDLQHSIRRHIDHGGTEIRVDSVPECSHCGSKWTEESSEYNGGCCDKDQAAAA